MKSFTKGLFAGSVIGIAGLAWAMSDSRTRKRMKKDTFKVIGKANEALENMSDIF